MKLSPISEKVKIFFNDWFDTYVRFDVSKTTTSTELYENYFEHAKQNNILPLRKKTFVKECRSRLEKEVVEGRVECYYLKSLVFRGVYLHAVNENQI